MGPSLTLADGHAVALRLRSVARGTSAEIEDSSPDHLPRIAVDSHEVRYDRGDVVEWYRNGPVGLEQGFELRRRPLGPADEPVTLTMTLAGSLRAELGTQAIHFVDDEGMVRARYGALFVVDADAAVVPSHLELTREGDIHVVIDDAAARYPLTVDPLLWVQQATFVSSDVAQLDAFGEHVSLSGDTVAVGVPNDDDAGAFSGSVYVFVRSGGMWLQQQKITAFDAATADEFGAAVALDGDTLLVGSYRDDDGGDSSGSVYVYVRSGTTWSLEQKLLASDTSSGDSFGFAVALQGDTTVIGASHPSIGLPGAAYVFTRSGSTWTEQQKLTPSDPGTIDRFGGAVALSGDTAIIGAPTKSMGANNTPGAAYAFVESGGTWTEQQKMLSSDLVDSGKFGAEISFSGDTVIIAAPNDDLAGPNTGSAYVFVESGGTWTEQQKLTATAAATQDAFGRGVSVEGDTAVVGAPGSGGDGAVFVFARAAGVWTQEQRLEAIDGSAGDAFGSAVDLDGNTFVTGAIDVGLGGAAYVSDLLDVGQSCSVAGDCPSGFCVDGVCCNGPCGGGDDGDCQACAQALTGAEDGTCAPVMANVECRAVAGDCDLAEVCDGTSTTCPADEVAPSSTVCRPEAGGCDEPELCTGTDALCPEDELSPAGTICRPAPGACDVEEQCTGATSDCPTNEFVDDGTVCDDGDSCTEGDACMAGTCEPGPDSCGMGGAGGGGAGGSASAPSPPDSEGGCSCRAAGARAPSRPWWAALVLLMAMRRRRCRGADRV